MVGVEEPCVAVLFEILDVHVLTSDVVSVARRRLRVHQRLCGYHRLAVDVYFGFGTGRQKLTEMKGLVDCACPLQTLKNLLPDQFDLLCDSRLRPWARPQFSDG